MLAMYRVPTQHLPHTPETLPTVSVEDLTQYSFAQKDEREQKTKGNYTMSEQVLK